MPVQHDLIMQAVVAACSCKTGCQCVGYIGCQAAYPNISSSTSNLEGWGDIDRSCMLHLPQCKHTMPEAMADVQQIKQQVKDEKHRRGSLNLSVVEGLSSRWSRNSWKSQGLINAPRPAITARQPCSCILLLACTRRMQSAEPVERDTRLKLATMPSVLKQA